MKRESVLSDVHHTYQYQGMNSLPRREYGWFRCHCGWVWSWALSGTSCWLLGNNWVLFVAAGSGQVCKFLAQYEATGLQNVSPGQLSATVCVPEDDIFSIPATLKRISKSISTGNFLDPFTPIPSWNWSLAPAPKTENCPKKNIFNFNCNNYINWINWPNSYYICIFTKKI